MNGRYENEPPFFGLAKIANDLDCENADDYAMADVEGRVRFHPAVTIDRRPTYHWVTVGVRSNTEGQLEFYREHVEPH